MYTGSLHGADLVPGAWSPLSGDSCATLTTRQPQVRWISASLCIYPFRCSNENFGSQVDGADPLLSNTKVSITSVENVIGT